MTWTPILTRNGEGAGTRILRIRCLPLVAFCPWQNRNVEVFLGLVIIAQAKHPAPSRTWQLSAVAPMVLRLKTWESRSLPNLVKPLLNRISLNDNKKTPSGAGWSSPVARQAHNLKVVGSNPTPATKIIPNNTKALGLASRGAFCFCAFHVNATSTFDESRNKYPMKSMPRLNSGSGPC